MTRPHACPYCQCVKRRGKVNPHLKDVNGVRPLVQEIVYRYGSLSAAGREYSDRYGLWNEGRQSSGQRLFERILGGQEFIRAETIDRIEVFAAS